MSKTAAQLEGLPVLEHFTFRARLAIARADWEAHHFNHEYVDTEHILLGLLDTIAGADVLKQISLDPQKVGLEVVKMVKSGPVKVPIHKLPHTVHAKKVIDHAIEEARSLKVSHVDTGHILLGLMHEQEGIGATVLVSMGLNLQDAREEILRCLASSPGWPPTDLSEHDNWIIRHMASSPQASRPEPKRIRWWHWRFWWHVCCLVSAAEL